MSRTLPALIVFAVVLVASASLIESEQHRSDSPSARVQLLQNHAG